MRWSEFVPFAFTCFHPSLCLVLMGGMLIIAWPHNCPSSPGERKLKLETAAERFTSIRPSVTSPATCAMPAMASSARGHRPQLSPRSTPSASLWINKICFPGAWLWPEWHPHRWHGWKWTRRKKLSAKPWEKNHKPLNCLPLQMPGN